MNDFETIDPTALTNVQGGNGLVRLGVRGAQAAWSGVKAAGSFVKSAFTPAEKLNNAKNVSDYVGQVSRYGAAGAGATEVAGRAINGTSPLGLPTGGR